MNDKLTGLKRLCRQDVLLAALALGCGIGGAWLAAQYLHGRAAATEAKFAGRYATRAVVVAASDVAAGEVLRQEKLAARPMPQEFLPSDAVPVERAAELLGGRATIDIRRGTPIVPAAVQAGGASPRLSGLLATGERALTIAVDELNSHAGAIEVGDRVDVYYRPQRSGDAWLMPLLQKVEVLATGSVFLPVDPAQPGVDRHYGTVTLRVTGPDANRLLLAQASGDLAVLLRAPGDVELQAAVLQNSGELLRRPAKGAPRPVGVEVLTGGSGGIQPVRTWLTVSREAS